MPTTLYLLMAAAIAVSPLTSAQPAPTTNQTAVVKPATNTKTTKTKTTKTKKKTTTDTNKKTTTTAATGPATTCRASFYDEDQMTASGERFNPNALTAAHKTLPLGSKLRVTNPTTGATVTVRINDRGPYVGGRCLDLSAAAFSKIANPSAGTALIRMQPVK
ncbi:septal ring lytic transglycosylase RlpA family protein [Dermatophilus congolensis]|uniref:septal ring lytic transglycosylase RlpA family protein n=1 Tax=Dermatophilus congolensis TaxID=1863 RepID=UPI001AAE5658|nr:septal ring lytic transglycosylase RlpA family protein [Dermatophilus congolensis]MBO3142991.1 septal ring lytic transglycosylase RlpA family protein [Dermatophilus congolensis]MBO3151980.1 septal ring lytic transglycosylase RlpA family protein [Dermatophilus congolensis]MBO3161012.1 septal ring lytic transglycosylase RlpA family protein [Dermatophilus congolensis]MBO3163264.1 septal ring lytic transglycosylase RlpA family protein [Dermatophilus congolensis]MBO3176821.1 septal ring lytic tr